MVDGLEYIMETAEWYMVLCRLLLRTTWASDSDFQEAQRILGGRVTSLYVAILGYQVKCVCRCYHDHPISANINVILGRLNWKMDVEMVKVREEGIRSELHLYNTAVTNELLQSVKSSAEELPRISNMLSSFHREIRRETLVREKRDRERYQSELTGKFHTTPYQSQLDANNVRIEGTCKWFSQHPSFSQWLNSESGNILLASADPGCGKSVLASHLVNDVLPDEKPETTICYYFFKDDAKEDDLANAYSALLHQLFLRNGKLADQCKFSIEQGGPKLTKNPSFLWNIFTQVVKQPDAGPIVCILDALDECSVEGLRSLVKDIVSLYRLPEADRVFVDVRFLLTTRGYPSIIDQFRQLQPFCIRLSGESKDEIKAIQKEIDLVVEQRMKELVKQKQLDASQVGKLTRCLRERGGDQRNYIWVKLVFQVLQDAYPSSNGEWENLVRSLPPTVSEAYAKLLQRVRPDQQERVMTLLHLILAAYRPLSLREMNIALHVRNCPGAASIDTLELASDNAFRNWIIDSCGFFVTEYDNKVSLIHQTAKDFLLETAGANIEQPKIKSPITKIDLPSAHAVMAESCISYLSLKMCQAGAIHNALSEFVRHTTRTELTLLNWRTEQNWTTPSWLELSSHKFTTYVIEFWLWHFRHAQRIGPTSTWIDVGDLYIRHYDSIFKGFETYQPTILASLRAHRLIGGSFNISDTVSMRPGLPSYRDSFLFFADRLRITSAPEETTNDEEVGNFNVIAALCGHLRAMKLSNNAFQVSGGSSSITPGAAPSGFLDQSTSLDPLCVKCAVIGRSVPCLEYLISCRLPLTSREPDDQIPLYWAVVLRYPDIVDFLVNNGAIVNTQTDNILTLLSECLSYSPWGLRDSLMSWHHWTLRDLESIIRVLLTREEARTIPLETSFAQDTLLHLIASKNWGPLYVSSGWKVKGSEITSALPEDNPFSALVNLGANPNALDSNGETPLILACRDHNICSVAFLLSVGADPDLSNSRGLSPLISILQVVSPLQLTRERIVTLLLEHHSDPNVFDPEGRSALCVAFESPRVSIISSLLRHGADVGGKMKNGLTPICEVLRLPQGVSRERITMELLKHGADPNEAYLYEARDYHSRLRIPSIGPQARTEARRPYKMPGTTPLHAACWTRDPFLVRQLLGYGADPVARDAAGNTPLHLIFEDLDIEWGDEPWIEKTIKLLLWNRTDLATVRNQAGKTPIDPVLDDDVYGRWRWLRETTPELYE